MKGYEVRETFNPTWKAFSFKFFLTKKEAQDFVIEQKAFYKRINPKAKMLYRIIPNDDITRCKCGRLYSDECLSCEKNRYDADQERQENERYEATGTYDKDIDDAINEPMDD